MEPTNYTLKYSLFGILVFLLLISGCTQSTNEITFISDNQDQKTEFAISEIRDALQERGLQLKKIKDGKADLIFTLVPESIKIKPEGYQIEKSDDSGIKITASDAAGTMYGGLELAEQIKLYGVEGVKPMQQNPYMEMRGTKFNIPLDVRTPSYTDAGDAGQKNMPEMWNYDFWTEYIDNIARYRYNFISLWSLHPFPSMVKVPGYEDVALDDVHRSTTKWNEFYSTWAVGLDAPEIVDNYEVLKKITIDQKIIFWQKVMEYAKSRNVKFYIITWNIFVNGTNGKYGITDKIENEVTHEYFRETIKAMFRTYPELGGIGLTTGENMHKIKFDAKEDWAFDTYARGLMEVADEMPDRKFTFIHRQHQAGAREIAAKFKPLSDKKNIEFIYSFKYAKSHVFSVTAPTFHTQFKNEIGDLKTIWTLRNDDAYYYRWGNPVFLREFIQNIPHDISKGIYYGSDQWVWGREFTTKDVQGTRHLEVVKHWYQWLMMGRLSYNPNITNDRFIALLQNKFPETNAQLLFDAWNEASLIYAVTTKFHWGHNDIKWYIEGCKGRPGNAFNQTGFHDVNTFIKFPVHPNSGCIAIPDYVKTIVNGESTNLSTPFEISQKLHELADKTLELVTPLENDKNSLELNQTLHDIKTIALMGKYYAHKIAGSTNVALFRETGDEKYQKEAFAELTKALEYWENYAEIAMEQNLNPIWNNRVGYVDWVKTTEWVKHDIEIAKQN